MVAILFIIFDLEITFLFPWSVSLAGIDTLGFLTMIYFLFILTIGFVYEWQKGALIGNNENGIFFENDFSFIKGFY